MSYFENASQIPAVKSVLLQLSPAAQMYMRVGKITPHDVLLSVINMPRYGPTQAYDIMGVMTKSHLNRGTGMDREKLEGMLGERMRFTAVVKRVVNKPGFRGRPKDVLLLGDVRLVDDGYLFANELWKETGKWSAELDVGNQVEFSAKVARYERQHKSWRDIPWPAPPINGFTLVRPTNVRVIRD